MRPRRPAGSAPPSARAAELLRRAATALDAGRLEEAEREARELTRRDRRDPNGWQLLGIIASRRGWFDDAAKAFEAVTRLRPDDAAARCRLASARMYQGRFDLARKEFDQALRRRPGDAVALRGLAELLDRSGDAAAALEIVAPLADARPDDPEIALTHATLLRRTGTAAAGRDLARRLLDRPGTPGPIRRKLGFVLAQALDDLDDPDAAFDAYTAANAEGALPFDVERLRATVDRVIAAFPAAPPEGGHPSDRSIFIVGMPRSGSTLLEQILDAHPSVVGAGESVALNGVFARMREEGLRYPDDAPGLDDAARKRLAALYLDAVLPRHRGPAPKRVADKNLLNFFHAGLLRSLLPNARVIRCARSPLDNAISCFVTDLAPIGFPWAGDLRSIGLFLREEARLAAHWAAALPESFYAQAPYEEIVADPERWSRRLVAFCGLSWDDACLRFHETGRAVVTNSWDQVRRPVYRTAVERWRRYERHLGPLREVLGEGPEA